jgi:hypothetical protein
MTELGFSQATDDERDRRATVFYEAVGGCRSGRMTSSPVRARRLAILVHQRSDLTLPYQALAGRESARLFMQSPRTLAA